MVGIRDHNRCLAEETHDFRCFPHREGGLMKKIKLSDLREKEVECFVYENPGLTIEEISKKLGISYKTAQRYLRRLRAKRRICARFEGGENIQHFYPNPSLKVENMTQLKILIKILEEG